MLPLTVFQVIQHAHRWLGGHQLGRGGPDCWVSSQVTRIWPLFTLLSVNVTALTGGPLTADTRPSNSSTPLSWILVLRLIPNCVFQPRDLNVCTEGVPQTEGLQSSQLDQFILRRSGMRIVNSVGLNCAPCLTSSSCLIRDHRLSAAGSCSSAEEETEEVEVRGGAATGGATGRQQVSSVRHLQLGRRWVCGSG